MGVLPAPLGRDVGHAPLDDLQQRLLHPLAGDVAGNGGVGALAGELIDLVDVDDAVLGAGHIVVGRLDEAQEDILHVLAHVPGLGQARGVGDGEGDVQDAGHGLGEQGLAGARGPDEEDVALLDLPLFSGGVGPGALVVVVHRHAEHPLGPVLGDDVLVEAGDDFPGREGLGHFDGGGGRGGGALLGQHLLADPDALVTDKDSAGPGDQPLHLGLDLATERARALAPTGGPATCWHTGSPP